MYSAIDIIKKRKELWQHNKSIAMDKEYTKAVAQQVLESPELRQEIKLNPELLIEMTFVIVDKDKKTIPFFLNFVQKDFVQRLNKAIKEKREGKRHSISFLILKGRQQGFTSEITAYQLACTITARNYEGFTAADEDGNTATIFENKAKFPYNNLPEPIKPTEKYNNRRQLLFEKLHSSWEVKTASKNMGRSRTINFFHGSEAAFWRVAISEVQAGLGEALTKDAIQILESTANGYNEYKDLWDSGKWENCFYEWWLTPEYRHHFESKQKEAWFKKQVATKKNEWIFKRCRWLLEEQDLEWEQAYWYYNKWNSYIDGEVIKQEYPCYPEEAFLSSGRCVFNMEVVSQRLAQLRKVHTERPPKRGRFSFEWNDPETKDRIKDETIRWADDPNGYITIYEDVQQGYPFVLGGDTKGEGKDYYTGTVINNATGVRCASIREQWTNSKPYTHQMYCMGVYYNMALIGIEMNWNTGPIEELERLKYPRQYVRRKYDNFTKKHEDRHGWKTDGNTRPLIIDREIDLIENNIDLFNDIVMLGECLTFVYDEDNRPDAQSGKHDDQLFSDMIANEIRSQQTTKITQEKKPVIQLPEALQSDKPKGKGEGWLEW